MKEKEIMLGVPEDDTETVELDEHRAMIYLPENAVEVKVNAKVYHEGELIDASKKMSLEDIREAFRKADDGYIDDDDVFYLTDKGKALLEECKNSSNQSN